VLDADAVEKTLRQLEDANEKRTVGDPAAREARARALAAMESLRTRPEKLWEGNTVRGDFGGDLLTASIGVLLSKLW
jgi:hypothetical protein